MQALSQAHISNSVTEVGSKPTFFPLQKHDLIMAWPLIQEFLAGRRGSFLDQWDIPELYQELMQNPDMYLWIAHSGSMIDGMMLVCFSNTPKERQLWIIGVICDNVKIYLPLHTNLEQWACVLGAKAVLFEGAHGWKRLLRRYGYATPTAMVKKDIRTMWRH